MSGVAVFRWLIVLGLLSICGTLFSNVRDQPKSLNRNIKLGVIAFSGVPLILTIIYAFLVFDGTCDNFKGRRSPCSFIELVDSGNLEALSILAAAGWCIVCLVLWAIVRRIIEIIIDFRSNGTL